MNTKKLISRVAALALALCMILAMACTGFAAEANDVINNSKTGVVQILMCYNDDVQGPIPLCSGTGFLINNNTVITCDHVVSMSVDTMQAYAQVLGITTTEFKNRLVVRISVNRDVTIGATIKTASAEMDYAILTMESQLYDRTYLPIRTGEISTTESVYALGFPGVMMDMQDLNIYTSSDVTVTSGTVIKYDRFTFRAQGALYKDVDSVAHSAVVIGGNSGGPLLDANGAVVGINAVTYDNGTYNLSVAIDQLVITLKSLGIEFTEFTSVDAPTTVPTTPTNNTTPDSTPDAAPVPEVDKTQLNAAITDAQKVDLAAYTKESAEAFNKAMDNATSMMANENATQAQVDDAIKSLSEAKLALEEVKSFPVWIIIVAVVVVVIVVIILIIVMSGKKKKNKAAPMAGSNFAPPAGGGFTPVNNVPANNFAASAVGAGATSVLNAGAGETSVLNAGAGETTVLNNATNMGSLTRKKTGENIKINSPSFIIGKEQAKVNYCVSNNTNVSRTHVRLTSRGGVTYVTDLGSTNGTTLNGVRLIPNKETALSVGDKITLGDEDFVYNAY